MTVINTRVKTLIQTFAFIYIVKDFIQNKDKHLLYYTYIVLFVCKRLTSKVTTLNVGQKKELSFKEKNLHKIILSEYLIKQKKTNLKKSFLKDN